MRRHSIATLRACAALGTAIAAVAVAPRAGGASLFVADDGTQLRWDTTLQQTEAFRLLPRLPALLRDPNADDGDRHFSPGPVSDRTDIFSEVDYGSTAQGVRLSAAGWYDPVYLHGNGNELASTFNPISVAPGVFPDAVKRLEGRHAELFDAFAYRKFALDGSPVSIRLGRYTLSWGESLFFGGNGIASLQAPQDIIRARSVPESTAKELFLPVAQVSASVRIADALTLELYQQPEWRRDRLPGVESYFSTADFLDAGGERILLAGGKALRRTADETPDASGQFGVGLTGTAGEIDWGVYAAHGDAHAASVVADPADATYHLAYAAHLTELGVSASTFLDDDTLAGEASFHRGVPVGAAALLPQQSQHVPRADSVNGQVSVVSQLAPNAFWNSADLLAELAANAVTHATDDAAAASRAGRAEAAVEAQFSPHYFHVADGADLTPSVSLEYGLFGRTGIDNEIEGGSGSLSASLALDYRVNWHGQLSFTHFIGAPSRQLLADRDFLAISVLRTF